jgi:short-subunit dehydrogenase
LPKSIAVFGAGPGLGHAVARRYAQDGYEVVVVARHRPPLDLLAQEPTQTGAKTYVITADLADTDAVPGPDRPDPRRRRRARYPEDPGL